MQTFNVEIKGITALLQHKFVDPGANEPDTKEAPTRKVLLADMTPREQAEMVMNKNGKGFFFPGSAIARLLREAGGGHKLKGTRKSVKYIVPAAVIVNEDEIIICNGKGKAAKGFEVDSRPVVIPATKGRIMRHRPRFDEWSAGFSLEIDETVLPPDLIHTLLEEGGKRQGIGDYRPEKGGPFGRFQIVRWQEQKN